MVYLIGEIENREARDERGFVVEGIFWNFTVRVVYVFLLLKRVECQIQMRHRHSVHISLRGV